MATTAANRIELKMLLFKPYVSEINNGIILLPRERKLHDMAFNFAYIHPYIYHPHNLNALKTSYSSLLSRMR